MMRDWMIVQQFNVCVTNTVVLSTVAILVAIVTTVATTVAGTTVITIAITTTTEVDSMATCNLQQQKKKTATVVQVQRLQLQN